MPTPTSQPATFPHPAHLVSQEQALQSARSCLIWGWVLVGGGCLLALVPFFLGILMWFIAAPLIVTGLVLSIVAIAKGRTAGGICLLLFSIFVAPFVLILGPIIAALLGMAATSKASPTPTLPATSDISKSSGTPTTKADMEAH